MVPAKERGAWLREWKAELWHVAERQRAHTTAAFVAGAFRDAAILRDDLQPARKRDWQGIVSSPVHFLALLFAAMSVSVGLAFLFPGVRPLLLPAPYRDAHTLVIVSRDGASHSANPSISLGEFRYWQSAAQAVFSDLSFYDVVHKELHLGLGRGVALSVIRASGNLPALLQSPDFPDAGSMNALPKLVLSDAVWRAIFPCRSTRDWKNCFSCRRNGENRWYSKGKRMAFAGEARCVAVGERSAHGRSF